MATIEIWVDWKGNQWCIDTVDEQIIASHCSEVGKALQRQAHVVGPKKVTFSNVAPGALKYIIKQVEKYQSRYQFAIGGRLFNNVLAAQQTIDALGVYPSQNQVMGHLITHITKKELQPVEVEAVHIAYGQLAHHSRLWLHMIETVGYKFANNQYTEKQSNAMIAVCQQYPELDNAVLGRINQFKYQIQNRINHENFLAREEKRQAKAGESDHRAEEKKAQRSEEQAQGLRAINDPEAAAIGRGEYTFVIREGKKGG